MYLLTTGPFAGINAANVDMLSPFLSIKTRSGWGGVVLISKMYRNGTNNSSLKCTNLAIHKLLKRHNNPSMSKDHQNFIKFYRMQRGWTQEELAEKTMQTHATVQRHENGKREPNWEMIRLYADVFGVHPIDIMEGPSSPGAKDQAERDLLDTFRSLEDSAKSMYLHTLKSFSAEQKEVQGTPPPKYQNSRPKKKAESKGN